MSAVYRQDLGHSAACSELGHRGVLSPEGSYQLQCWPQSTKTLWRQDRAIGNPGEVGKILHQKVYDLYSDFLLRHHAVIVETWSIEVDGEGADRLKTLFPGYWGQTQLSRFNRLIHRALGCGLQKQRRILNKRFMQDHRDWGITRQAVDQQLRHSAEIGFTWPGCGIRSSRCKPTCMGGSDLLAR